MKASLPALLLALTLGSGGCARLNEAVSINVSGPDATADAIEVAAGPGETEVGVAEVPAGAGGVNPGRTLRAVEADAVRWRREQPSRLSSLPRRIDPQSARTGDKAASKLSEPRRRDGWVETSDEAFDRIDRAGRRGGSGTVCQGC